MVVIMMEMIAPIAIIEVIVGPRATIKIGPKATFGIEFKTTKYGSNIFDKNGDHQRMAAKIVPRRVPKIKPNTVSLNVYPKSINRDPSVILATIKDHTLEGALKIRGSI